jgi:hypothetical protein
MYSKAQLLTALKKEIDILEHLQSKIIQEIHDHKFTEPQRTIKDLLAYLTVAPWNMTKLIFTGDISLFADMKAYIEHFDPAQFATILHIHATQALSFIENADESSLAETVSLFNGFATGTRAQLLVEMVYGQLLAYKMQLFLQMKHAGLSEIGSMNLWSGMDKPVV